VLVDIQGLYSILESDGYDTDTMGSILGIKMEHGPAECSRTLKL
jgi:hypothetical protein